MKKTFALLCVFSSAVLSAQNVGIGTTTPATKLHVVDGASEGTIRVETMIANSVAELQAKTKGGLYDALRLQKWAPGSSGTIAGIPLDNLSTVLAGANAGPLVAGTQTNSHFHFLTNNIERMRINDVGWLGINTVTPSSYLHVVSTNGTTPIIGENLNTGSLNEGIVGTIHGSGGSGVAGVSYFGGGASPFESNHYGVMGRVGNNGVAVGAFALAGTALRARSTTGFALHTSGSIRFTGISEGDGKVLTSDASGNATWQTAAASQWAVNGTHIYSTNAGNIGIGITLPAQKLDVAGDIRANGYQFSTPRTYYYSLSGADFSAKIGSRVERREEISGGGVALESGTEGLVAPVHLPHGATVTRVTVYFFDNSTPVSLNIRLRSNAGIAALVNMASSGTPGNTSLTTTSISSPVIDNSTAAYVLEAYPTGGSWPAFDIIVRRVIIEYTLIGL